MCAGDDIWTRDALHLDVNVGMEDDSGVRLGWFRDAAPFASPHILGFVD